ncbi:MAG: ATP-binding protein [Vicinamibacterales bacterium]
MRSRLRAIDHLTKTTARAHRLEDIYDAALDAVGTVLGTTRSSILLFDPDGVIRFKSWRGLSDSYRRATEGHSPWSSGTTDPEPILVPDVRTDESLKSLRSTILAEGIAALAFFPLLHPTRLLGKFMAYYDTPHRFTEAEIMAGRIIAGDVAFAVERKWADETQGRLGAIVASSNDAIVSKDLQGIIQTWNPAAERLFGYSAAEAIGRSITMLIPPESVDEETHILSRIRRGERIEHYETVRVTKTGERLDISLAISPIHDAHGRIVGASKIARNITDQKQAQKAYEQLLVREQEARAEAEAANRAKDDFLATLSHELRTPLNSILGWAQILGGARNDAAMVDRALDTIVRNANQQARLIEDLLDLSSILGGRLRLNMQSVDVVESVSTALDSIRPAAAEKDLEIQIRCDATMGPVRGDPERLQQVFWNLLTNAVKFSPKHGRVDIRVERVRSQVMVRITDTGIGIRADALRLIFERFRQADSSMTRAHGGLGLGLAIVRELVEMHGGHVAAASPGEGQGATFTVTLPVAPLWQRPGRGHAGRAIAMTRCDGIRVLVVDDEPDGRELLSVSLTQCGGHVTAVESAVEALGMIAQDPPDVLVSDIAMPTMDGYELIRRVRALPGGHGIPAVALTAHANADARIEALRAGYDLYLTKPVDAGELSAVVDRLGRRPKSS